MQHNVRTKEYFTICECGCGQFFETSYKTRRPQYMNHTHRMRAYRARARQRAAEFQIQQAWEKGYLEP